GQGDGGALWPLCYRWRHQRDLAQGYRSGNARCGAGACPARRTRRQGPGQGQEEAGTAGRQTLTMAEHSKDEKAKAEARERSRALNEQANALRAQDKWEEALPICFQAFNADRTNAVA